MTFHIGQKVVCIDDEFEQGDLAPLYGVHLPRKGVIYHVRELEGRAPFPCVRLVEIVNPVIKHACGTICEPAYDCDCFRPVVEKKTDISIFTAILNPDRVMARAFNDHDSILNQP